MIQRSQNGDGKRKWKIIEDHNITLLQYINICLNNFIQNLVMVLLIWFCLINSVNYYGIWIYAHNYSFWRATQFLKSYSWSAPKDNQRLQKDVTRIEQFGINRSVQNATSNKENYEKLKHQFLVQTAIFNNIITYLEKRIRILEKPENKFDMKTIPQIPGRSGLKSAFRIVRTKRNQPKSCRET